METMTRELPIADRLGDLTRSIQERQKRQKIYPYFWLLCKHSFGGRTVSTMADEAPRFNLFSPDIAHVAKAAVAVGDTTSAGWASELAYYRGLTDAWVTTVTSKSLLGQIPYVRVPFLKKTISETSSVSAAWTGEGQPLPFSKMALTATSALGMKKIGVLVPFTLELFDSWGPAEAQNMEAAITRPVVLGLDKTLLDPDVATTSAHPGSLTNGIASGQSTGNSAAQIIADIKAMLASVIANTPDPSAIVVAMSPSSALHLSQLLTTGGVYAFPRLGVNGGDIWGFRVAVSPAASLLGSPGSNIIAAIDGNGIIVADDNLMVADASKVTALQATDQPVAGPANNVSFFQTESIVLRIVLYKNFERARTSAVAWFPAGY